MRAVCLLLCAGIVAAVPSGAAARVLYHHDLTSLALLSDAIVLAERGATRTLSGGAAGGLDLTEVRVRRVYSGLVAAGSTLEVPDATYELDGTPSAPLSGRSGEVVLFLARSGRAEPRWWVVASGVRVQVAGRLYRFEQASSPDSYLPVPQGRDPVDVREGRGADAPVDLATFEADLRVALARAAEVRAALRPVVGPRQRDRLLALLPPIQERLVGPGRGPDDYRDEVAHGVVSSLLGDGDLEGALEAQARVIGARPSIRGRAITSETMAAAALDVAQPLHRRIEALAALWDPAPASAAIVDRVAPLLDDPVPDVRAAAVAAIAAAARSTMLESVRAAARRTLGAAARRQADPLVRIALATAAGELTLRLPARGPAQAVVARRRGEELRLLAAWRGRDVPSAELVEVRAAGAPCEVSGPTTFRTGAAAGLSAQVRCPDATAPWSVTVTLRSGRAQARQTLEVR